ncbi:pilus assembly protein [Actinotalea sp. M2MS4P-6]|uniref:TadE/TadG family type IV pilus assembly protein n=1 Tax=Actinotalea sp. M2MS4P-6 TaxID=2983762 RepID=UPI0021E39E18|nr:TadE/TadG family type IV pilus assembly protein [Actinotalea sp. M2MS4P-6]MCV2394549.1 pilus assembly protein [Actinotalea sp. M2MS4P-6]
MAVEVVVLVPVMLGLLLLVVAMGRFVSAQGVATSLARDAVRAASLERDADSALDVARRTAAAAPGGLTCSPAELDGAFAAGGVVTVVLDCRVSWDQLGFIGLPGSVRVTGTSSAPIDVYRRTAP